MKISIEEILALSEFFADLYQTSVVSEISFVINSLNDLYMNP